MTSMHDVAKRAGVSVAAVSYYINGTKPLRPVTREKIKRAIEELNFHPNTTARSLKQSSSKEIGVILPSISDPYYAGIFKGIENILRSDGNTIILAFSDEIKDNEKRIVSSFLEKRIGGIIAVTCQPSDTDFFEKNILHSDVPAVFVDRIIPYLDLNYVCVNNYRIVYELTGKLLKKGYRKIAVITGPSDYSSDYDCILAYREAHKAKGTAIDERLICSELLFKETAFAGTLRLFSGNTVDAVITSSQLLLEGVLEALHILHLEPGKDIPVISLGLDIWNEHTFSANVFLTKRPAIDIGEKAALLLKESIQSSGQREKQVVCFEDNVTLDFYNIAPPRSRPRSKADSRKTLRILMEGGQRFSSAMASLARDFELREDAEVVIHTRPMEEMLEYIHRSSPGDGCDIIMYDIPWLPSLASEGLLSDITDYMSDVWSPQNSLSSTLPSIYGEFDGKFYGIPFIYAPPILFYRKDLFDDTEISSEYFRRFQMPLRPPRTWMEYNAIIEFFNTADSCKDRCIHGGCLYGQTLEHLIPNFLPRLSSFGGMIYNSNLQITINSAACRKALESLKTTASLSTMPFLSSTVVSATQEFFEGKTALLFGHSSYATEYSRDTRSKVAGKVGYAPLPGRTPHISGWGLGISTSTAQRELALKFFNWLSRSDIRNYMTILNGQSLLYGSKPNSELLKVYPWLPLEMESFRDIRPRSGAYLPSGKVIARNLIEECLYKNICGYLTDRMSLEDTISAMENELKELFARFGYNTNL